MTAIPNTDATGPAGWTDADLALAAAAGDRRAFAAIYDRYADRLHDFCIGMLRDRDSAADCVQDTFCVAATNLTGLREPDKLRPWLYAIARREALGRLRDRRRERPSDELPDAASREAGPSTLAHRMELANLIAEAAGGLADRDRAVLELSYRHGMDGPELAEALGVSHTNAGTLVHRVRDMVERCLGALLVSRRVQSNPAQCPQLSAILHGWDGHFTVLIRKRVSRHIETCSGCDRERRRLVNPATLLGAAPALIPAPGWLRDRTMREVQLTSSAGSMVAATAPTMGQSRNDLRTNAFEEPLEPATDTAARDQPADTRRRFMLLIALMIGIPLAVLGVVLAWLRSPSTPVAPIGETLPSATATSANPLPSGSATSAQPTGATRGAPGTTAAVPGPSATDTATAPATTQPSAQPPSTSLPNIPAQTPPPTGGMQAPPPPTGDMQAPPPPTGDMQAPPQTTGPAPATTYAPPPPPPPDDQLPPLKTYNPDLPYTEDPFVGPN